MATQLKQLACETSVAIVNNLYIAIVATQFAVELTVTLIYVIS